MIERLVDRLVGVADLHVLAHEGDPDFMLGVLDPLDDLSPFGEVERVGPQTQALDQDLVQPVIDQRERHFVDAELLVALFDDRLALDVAKKGDLVFLLRRDRMLGPADQDIRLDADLPQHPDRMLGRLGLELAGGPQIGDEREMDVQAILAADIQGKLANRLQKRQALDVADRAADLGDHHVDVVARQAMNRRFDLVGDVRNDLDGLPFVDLARRVPSGSPRDRSFRSCGCCHESAGRG